MTEFDTIWRHAKMLQNDGKSLEALDAYEKILAREPWRLYVRMHASQAASSLGHYKRAREHAVQCSNYISDDRLGDLPYVTRLLLAYDETMLVRRLILEADWSRMEIHAEAAVLCQHLWLCGEVEKALELADRVLPIAPKSASLAYSRGLALKYLGRTDEAVEEFERCIQLRPGDAAAHWSLSFLKPDPNAKSRIPRMLDTLRVNVDNSENKGFLHYALFRELEAAGDLDAAWQQLMLGASSKRSQLSFNTDEETTLVQSLKQLELPALEPRDDQPTPIFIVGMPRTGTTLIERVIGSHAQVAALGELNDFDAALSWNTDAFKSQLTANDFLEKCLASDLEAVGVDYLRTTRERTDAFKFFIDKNPANFFNVPLIARALPSAKIVCLRKPAMDACFSNLKEYFTSDAFPYSYDLDELAAHYLNFNELAEHWAHIAPDRFLIVDYNKFVEDPDTQARRMANFCGFEYEQESLRIESNEAPSTTASAAQVRERIHNRSVDAWRKYEKHLKPLSDAISGQASIKGQQQ